MRVHELLDKVADELQHSLASGTYNGPVAVGSANELDNTTYEQTVEGDDEDDDFDEMDNSLYLDYDDYDGTDNYQTTSFSTIDTEIAVILEKRIRQDLHFTKSAGFKIGIISGMKPDSESSILSLSVQVVKLGLSEEAIDAWDLQKQQYIVLLIKYLDGYKTFDAVISNPARSSRMEFRIGICNGYKPSVEGACAAFATARKIMNTDLQHRVTLPENKKDEDNCIGDFRSLFISSSLSDFMNEQFVSLVKIRHSMGLGWEDAKRYLSEKQGAPNDQSKSRGVDPLPVLLQSFMSSSS